MPDPTEKPAKPPEKIRLGTFSCVFMPSFLTIMGVIIFLRMGYVVGNAGFLQGLLIILLANLISVHGVFQSWIWHGKILKLKVHRKGDMRLWDRAVPLLRKVENTMKMPLGLSLFLVANKG